MSIHPPQPAHCTQAEAVSQMALGGRMTRFITLTFSTNLLGPFWWHLTMSSMSGTDIPRGMKPMDPCLPPLFSPFKKKNQPNPTNHWLTWNILPPHHKQRDTHPNTRKLHIPGGPDPPWAQRYLQECPPVRQSVPLSRDPGAGLLHGSRLSWQLNNGRPTVFQSLQPKILPNKSPSEKEQPPNSRAPLLGHQQNPRLLFWKKS